MAIRRLILVLLCAVTALGTPLSRGLAAVGEEPCMSSGMSHGTPMDCDCATDKTPSCAEHCAALFAATVLASDSASSATALPDERVTPVSASNFESRAGPPGLQPPR